MPKICRPITPAEQIRAVERKVGHRLSRLDRLDVVDAAQEYVCTPPSGGLGRRPAVRQARHSRRR